MFSILLRVLLSLSLVLNGSGYAMASTHMQMGHMATVASVPQPAAQPVAKAKPPCHPQPGNASTAVVQLPDVMHNDAGDDTAPAKSKHPSPDCCKSGACRCACLHQAQAAMPTYGRFDAVVEHASSVHPLKSGHAAPALPHLIRPPIS